jgi:hypothetical protein
MTEIKAWWFGGSALVNAVVSKDSFQTNDNLESELLEGVQDALSKLSDIKKIHLDEYKRIFCERLLTELPSARKIKPVEVYEIILPEDDKDGKVHIELYGDDFINQVLRKVLTVC